MPEIPLLGSLQSYTVVDAADGALLAEGPLFTANKINKNGGDILEDEAENFAASFTGMPIQYCPKGVDTVAKDGSQIPAAHYCDAINSSRTIVEKALSSLRMLASSPHRRKFVSFRRLDRAGYNRFNLILAFVRTMSCHELWLHTMSQVRLRWQKE